MFQPNNSLGSKLWQRRHQQSRVADDLSLPLLQLIAPQPARVLEIGCYCGAVGRWLRRQFPRSELIGLDWRPEALEAAAGAYDRLIAAAPEPLDLDAAGLKRGSLDAIVINHVLEQLDDPWGFLRELSRWLAPGGALYLSLFNLRNLAVVYQMAEGRWRYQRDSVMDFAHRRFFTRAESVDLLADTGWRCETLENGLDPTLLERFGVKDLRQASKIHAGRLKLEGLAFDDVLELFTLRFYIKARKVEASEPESSLDRPTTVALLATWWRELLTLEGDPDLDDHFFALGGHSLLVAQLALRVEAQFGCPLPLEAFFAEPRLGSLARAIDQVIHEPSARPSFSALDLGADPQPSMTGAARRSQPLPPELRQQLWTYAGSWRGERARPDSLIVGAHVQGRRPPLFWCFQGEYEYQQLADHIGPEQPLYGMRSGHRVMDYLEENIQALAMAYLEELEALVPDGPIAIGGTCQGAAIAQAMAGHLLRRGRTPTLMLLLDWTGAYHPYPGPVALLFGRESRDFNPYLCLGVTEIPWGRLFPEVRIEIVPGQHTTLMDRPNVSVLAKTITALLEQSGKRVWSEGRALTPKDLLQPGGMLRPRDNST
ncbi:MAG: methyltransferase domain-containing protein [Chromatiaceae bacterium]|nr:methyltransferase domain-containing protein [Chromatiaceae bacterium]